MEQDKKMSDIGIGNVTNKDNQVLLSRFYDMQTTGNLGQNNTANGVFANIVAYGFVFAHQKCSSSVVINQKISINCNENLGSIVENNRNCLACKRAVDEAIILRRKLEFDAVTLNPNYKTKIINETLLTKITGTKGVYDTQGYNNFNDGVCKYICKQCVLENIEQNIHANISVSCEQDTNSFSSAFLSGMATKAKAEVLKFSDGLNNYGNEDVKVNPFTKDSDSTKLGIRIAAGLKEITTIRLLENIKATAFIMQGVTIQEGSTSIMLDHVEQSVSFTLVAGIVSKFFRDDIIKGSINYSTSKQIAELERKNTNLLKRAKNTFETVESLIRTSLGQLLIIIIVICLIILFIAAGILYFKPKPFPFEKLKMLLNKQNERSFQSKTSNMA